MAEAPISTDVTMVEQPIIPVRRVHNYVYCPRLCYLQWVENIFVENADTAAGDAVHRRVDTPTSIDADRRNALSENLPSGHRLKSLHLTSEKLNLTGIVDLIEAHEDGIRIVEYKRGSALRNEEGERVAKEYDAIQIALHALLLEETGVKATSGSIYYATDRQHVSIVITEQLLSAAKEAIEQAKATCKKNRIPPPLVNDLRCSFCSAYSVCLPNESYWWSHAKDQSLFADPQLQLGFESFTQDASDPEVEDEEKVPPRPERTEGEILIVQTAGTQVGQRGGEFVVTQKKEVLRKLPVHQVKSIYLYGAVQITAQAIQSCLELNVEVGYFSAAGRFLGSLQGLPASGVDARKGQYTLFEKEYWQLKIASECIWAKIRNQRVMLMRNGTVEKVVLAKLARFADSTRRASSIDELRGIEGIAAAEYFGAFSSMLKGDAAKNFDFNSRNRRPPKDPLNALLSLGYSVLAKEIAGICHIVGLDPFYGFYHRPRYGRPALALDLMEEFRPLIADSVAISLINRGELDQGDFYFSTRGVSLNDRGRRRFWEAWFRRLDTEVTHPQFQYKMSYRRMMEVQARQLWRFVRGEALRYHAFTTR